MRSDKLQRLAEIARLYYEQNKTQNEIAKQMGVSRPLISRMLQESRTLGIVEIHIHQPGAGNHLLLNRAKNRFSLSGGALVPQTTDDSMLNQSIAFAAIQYLQTLHAAHLGIGWGQMIGVMASMLESQPPMPSAPGHVCPLVGNSGISIRSYHSNENVRMIAQQLQAEPHYLYTPAFCETQQELELVRQTEHFQAVAREWELLDAALVNIGEYPSTPDFASYARFGDKLTREHAVGRIVAYYCNPRGEIICSNTDYAVQIPLPLLARCPHVVGICGANISAQALLAALNTGLITDIIACEGIIREILACN